uniref:Uncharacterized protein n=1 Tax=viral metagenome TaxID=1070528 RepID=A0A6M3LB08_9ZZZZ
MNKNYTVSQSDSVMSPVDYDMQPVPVHKICRMSFKQAQFIARKIGGCVVALTSDAAAASGTRCRYYDA